MARFLSQPEFLQDNINILSQRTQTLYSVFLEQKPTFVTYYHVNKILSTTDKGMKNVEALNGARSPIKYNKILDFPIYGIENIVLQLDEDEHGLDTDYDGEGIILPNTIHPTGDDYFTINYLEKKYTFRVTRWQYDTIKSNSYYKIEFTIRAVDPDIQNDIENQVVRTYNCIFNNIGTDDKCIIGSDITLDLNLLGELIDTLRKSYLDLFYIKKYNAILFHESEFRILFDPNLTAFCNDNRIFYEYGQIDTIFLYEERRDYFPASYSKSIYDRITHRDYDDLDYFDKFYDVEPAINSESIFNYWRDRRIKYMIYYSSNESVFDERIPRYIDANFIKALEIGDSKDLFNELSLVVYNYFKTGTDHLLPILRKMRNKRYRYTLHNFVFIPLVIYCIRQLYKSLTAQSQNDYYSDRLVEYTAENV